MATGSQAGLEGRVRALEAIMERLTTKTLDQIADALALHGKALREHKEALGRIIDELDDCEASLESLTTRACTEIVREKEA